MGKERKYVQSKNLNTTLNILIEDLYGRTDMERLGDGTYIEGVSSLLSREDKLASWQLACFGKAIMDLGMALSVEDGDTLAGVVNPLLTRISHAEFGNLTTMEELEKIGRKLEEQFANINLKFPDKFWKLKGGV